MVSAIGGHSANMRICFITGIFPPEIGGPATYVSRLAEYYTRQGHEVRVVTLGAEALDLPFRVRRIARRHALPLRLLLVCWACLREGWRSEVWYINGLELPAVLAGKLLRKRLVMKIVSDYAWERAFNQGLTRDSVSAFQQTKQCWKVELHRALRAWLPRQVETVITPGQYVKRLVCGWGVPDNHVQVIYNAIDPLTEEIGAKDVVRRELGLPPDAALLLTVGRLIPLKGIDRVLAAVAQLRAEFGTQRDLQLVIVGDGPEKKRLTEIAATLNLGAAVHFIGQVGHREVLAYMRAADVFVLNSSTEGLSHVILEAMLMGAPVIATAVGGNPELIAPDHSGILIQHGDFDELQAQLKRLLLDARLQETLRDGARQVVQRFSWERLLQETHAVLSKRTERAS